MVSLHGNPKPGAQPYLRETWNEDMEQAAQYMHFKFYPPLPFLASMTGNSRVWPLHGIKGDWNSNTNFKWLINHASYHLNCWSCCLCHSNSDNGHSNNPKIFLSGILWPILQAGPSEGKSLDWPLAQSRFSHALPCHDSLQGHSPSGGTQGIQISGYQSVKYAYAPW